MRKLEEFFELKRFKTSIKIEVLAGVATFLAMAYILVVNPNNILWNGTMDPRWSGVFIATAIGAFLGTLFMALIAKMPYAQASGMGINAIVGSIIGGGLGFSFSYGNAMLLIFLSGIIFLLLSFLPGGYSKKEKRYVSLREKIFEGMPKTIQYAIPVGIGLFITFVGLQNAKLITDNQFTLVQLVDFNNSELWVKGGLACHAIVSLFGLLVITILSHYKVKGAIIIGILSSTLLSIPLGVADINILLGKTSGITWNFISSINNYFGHNGVFLSVFKEGLHMPKGSFITCAMTILTFCMVDLFDTIGTIIGCSRNAGLIDEDGKPLNYSRIMYADSMATLFGSLVGTSSVTTFVESGTGIAQGGRTGLTSLVTALLFLLSIIALPLFAFIPSAAASSALIYVGVLMISNIKDIDFKKIKYAVPSFMTIVMMPLTYSITNGIGLGVISYVIINLIIYGIDFIKYKRGIINEKPIIDITLVTIIVTILFMVYFLVPTNC